MLIENITFSSTELNLSSGIARSLSGVVITHEGRKSYYGTKQIDVLNSSGATIYFVPMSTNEYTIWDADHNYSNYIPVVNNGTKSILKPVDDISTIICSGSAGHSAGVTFIVMKERY